MARTITSGLLCLIGLAAWFPQVVSGEDPAKPKQMLAKDLADGKIQIIGLLGKPYGEIVRIRGVWEAVAPLNKDPAPNFRITHVEGKKLATDREIVIEYHEVELAKYYDDTRPSEPGEVYEGRVYESGGYVRAPQKVREILGELPVQDVHGFKFYTFLYLIDKPTHKKK